jgi:hypothetical protein
VQPISALVFNDIAHVPITTLAFFPHPGKLRVIVLDIVINPHIPLAGVFPVQTARVLLERPSLFFRHATMQQKAVLKVFSKRLPQQGQLLGPLGQDNNFPAFFIGLDYVLRYVLVAREMNGEKVKNILDPGFGRRDWVPLPILQRIFHSSRRKFHPENVLP